MSLGKDDIRVINSNGVDSSTAIHTWAALFNSEFFNSEGIKKCEFSGHDDSFSYRNFGPSNQMDSVNSLTSQPRDAMSAGLNCEGTCRQDIYIF